MSLSGYLASANENGSLYTATILPIVISGTFVAMRFYTRAVIVAKLGVSDWMILAAYAFSVGYSACTISEIRIGSIGRHIWTISAYTYIEGTKIGYAANLLYIACLIFVKLSILLLYLQIFSPVLLHRLVYTAIGAVVVLSGFSFFSNIFICVPIAAYWDPFNYTNVWYWPDPAKWWIDISIHLFTEVMILLLPMPFLISLNIPIRRKIGIILLFALGIIVIIVSAVRLPTIVAVAHAVDTTWQEIPIVICTAVEVNTAVVCACCITLRPFLRRFFPGLFAYEYQDQGSVEIAAPQQNHPPTVGTRRQRGAPPPLEMFDDVFEEKPPRSSLSTASAPSPAAGELLKEERIA